MIIEGFRVLYCCVGKYDFLGNGVVVGSLFFIR